jgi:hypothetical protein
MKSVSGLLDGVPGGVDDGAVGGQLVHIGLHNKHLGVEDVHGGGECCQSWRQTPQSWLPQ